jgi:hypothetical protein
MRSQFGSGRSDRLGEGDTGGGAAVTQEPAVAAQVDAAQGGDDL